MLMNVKNVINPLIVNCYFYIDVYLDRELVMCHLVVFTVP